MIKHYLKIALRNLWNYKVHSLISVVCLSVGITCFSLMNYFLDTVTESEELPDYEHRIGFTFSSSRTGEDLFCSKDDVAYLEGQSLSGIDTLVASSYPAKAEVTVIDKNLQETPFLIRYRCVSPLFFSYYNKKLRNGNTRLTSPDEVIISREFARKVFGDEDPIGMIIHLETKDRHQQIRDYKIINVVASEDIEVKATDCYFPLSMNPHLALNVGTYLTGQTTLESLNKQLDQITWKRGELDIRVRAYFLAGRGKDVEKNIAMLLFRFIASLILLSGLINFMKFIIQMFYNRQRELALRKCMGSDTKGFCSLLFAEVFWMMSAAFMGSLVVTEVSLSLMYAYIPEEDMIRFSLPAVYGLQFTLYIALLLVCLSIIIYPVYQLRRLSIIHHIVRKQKRHVFRNIMIGLQLAISIFFVGGVCGITILYSEIAEKRYSPLDEEEEKKVISLSVNSIRMQQNMDAILSDIGSLSGITDRTAIFTGAGSGSFVHMNYKKDGHWRGDVVAEQGNPRYFEFFHIPMEGKIVDGNAQGMVYVSRKFREQLQADSIAGTVRLNGADYQVAGTYEALYKEEIGRRNVISSVFLVNPATSTYLFKVADSGKTSEAIRQITEICRRYVPDTLPLDIHDIGNTKQTTAGGLEMIQNISLLLAVISLLLVVLSIYSAISMDTISRQKEVAIRKINGATPKTIALLFGKTYLIIYLVAFCSVYPLVRLILVGLVGDKSGFTNIYRWDWGILLFFAMGLLIFCITAYKIYEVMHLNPASILKKE